VRLLLDTHFAFWWQTGDPRITEEVRGLVESADEVFVSSVSLWELTIKAGWARSASICPLSPHRSNAMGFTWLPIRNAHILELSTLPAGDDHRDPFDRLLVAQSMSEPLILLTVDGKLGRYGSTVRVV